MYLVISMCQDRRLGIVTVIPISDARHTALRETAVKHWSSHLRELDKTTRQRWSDNETLQISVSAVQSPAINHQVTYLRKLPEIPVWLMMKYFGIKHKDLTAILTNFKNSKLAIKLNEAQL